MTRINVVPVQELCSQHLFAEWRELPRMASYALKARPGPIPPAYTLNTGHMRFFLDKGHFLEERHDQLTRELIKRGYSLSPRQRFEMPDNFGKRDYVPTEEALAINRERITSRLPTKPRF